MRTMFQLAVALVLMACPALAAEEAAKKPAVDLTVLQVRDTDVIMGDEKAAVTIVEYASLSCPHC